MAAAELGATAAEDELGGLFAGSVFAIVLRANQVLHGGIPLRLSGDVGGVLLRICQGLALLLCCQIFLCLVRRIYLVISRWFISAFVLFVGIEKQEIFS